MKRIVNRVVGALLGVIIGWWAAGLMPGAAEVGLATEGAPKPHHHDHDHHDHDHDHDHVPWSSQQLVPQPGHADWACTYILGVVGLFASAVIIGVPALKLRGPEPQDPAAHHDDHAHDAHGHGGGHGHH